MTLRGGERQKVRVAMVNVADLVTDLGLAVAGRVTEDEAGTDSAEMSSPTPANRQQ